MNLNECKNCRYLDKIITANESYYECDSPKYSTTFPEFVGVCPYLEKVIDENKNIKELIDYIQDYIDSDMQKYEACYLTGNDLKLIIKVLKKVVNDNEDK